jgi:hypothetical protein
VGGVSASRIQKAFLLEAMQARLRISSRSPYRACGLRGGCQARRSITGLSRCASSRATPSPGKPVNSAEPFSSRKPSARKAGKVLSSAYENSQFGVTRPACTCA